MLHMLNHPHVVQFLGVTQNTKGDLMLLTEFCPQGSFADVIERHEYEPRKQFLRHATQLAKTMRWLHAKDVIHRDLKPGNVLLQTESGVHTPRITDFGFVKVLRGDTDLDLSVTRPGIQLGTPRYMAPEQASDAPVDQLNAANLDNAMPLIDFESRGFRVEHDLTPIHRCLSLRPCQG